MLNYSSLLLKMTIHEIWRWPLTAANIVTRWACSYAYQNPSSNASFNFSHIFERENHTNRLIPSNVLVPTITLELYTDQVTIY